MADWYGHARSNYFRVKDKGKFIQWADAIGDLEVIEDGEGRVGLLSSSDFGGWPYSRFDEVTDDVEDIDICEEVATHLQEGSVAIFMEIGAEKLRYLTGRALAVNSRGEVVEVALDNIYALAKPIGAEVTVAEY